MSRAKKHVTDWYTSEVDFTDEEIQNIICVTNMRGGNLCEVEFPNGEKVLALIPSKYKNVIWIRKGTYAIAAPAADTQASSKVRTAILHLLSPEQVKDLKKLGKWPAEFLTESEKKQLNNPQENRGKKEKEKEVGTEEEDDANEGADEGSSDEEIFVNPNHQVESESESDQEEEEEEENDGGD